MTLRGRQYPRNLSVKTQFTRTETILLIIMIYRLFLFCFKEDSFSCNLAFQFFGSLNRFKNICY